MLSAAIPSSGGPEAEESLFRELYSQHWDVLIRIAGQKTGDFQQSCDLVQDVFTYVWQERSFLTVSAEKARSYLVTCLYYRIFNYWRSKGLNEKHIASFGRLADEVESASVFSSPRYLEEQMEAIQVMIMGQLEKMPERMRQIFIMNRYQKKTVGEIAEELLLSEKTVRNQLSIGLRRLKDHAATLDGEIYFPLFLFAILSPELTGNILLT